MYKELCRLCGNKNEETLNIFSELGSNRKLDLKINQVVRLNISEEDPLPNIVCVLCIKHLDNASYFIDHCHQTQTYLNQLYQDSLAPILINDAFTLNSADNFTHDQFIIEEDDKLSKLTSLKASVLKTTAINCDLIENSNRRVSKDHEDDKTNQKYTELTNVSSTEQNNSATLISNNSNNQCEDNSSFASEGMIFGEKFIANNTGSTNKNSQIQTTLQTDSSYAIKFPVINLPAINLPVMNLDKSNNEGNKSSINENSQIKTIPQINSSTTNDRCRLKRKCNSQATPIVNQNNYEFDSTDDEDYELSNQSVKRSSQKSKPIPHTNKKNSTDNSKNSSPEQNESLIVPKTSIKENCSHRMEFKDYNRNRFDCTTCKKTFSQELTYQEHLNVHTGNRPFSCKLCTASFRRRQELNQHLRTVHSEKQFKCPICDHVAKHKGKLTEHIKSVHDKPFACDMCNYRTGEKGKIMQHIVNKHTNDLSYVCEVCGNGFKTKNSLQVHIKNIHFPEPKVCQICGMVCSSLARYSAHIFRCGKEKKKYTCEKCGQTYVNKEILKDHMNKHLNVKPYKCGVCGKAFYQRNRLHTHKYVHRGANYQCEICNQFFNRKDNMKNHMKRHFYKSMRCDNTIVTAV